MSASGRFETDVLLSFSDPDDAAAMPGEAGWVIGFRTALSACAQQILGRPRLTPTGQKSRTRPDRTVRSVSSTPAGGCESCCRPTERRTSSPPHDIA